MSQWKREFLEPSAEFFDGDGRLSGEFECLGQEQKVAYERIDRLTA
jgi:hypothetical protein